PRAPRSRRPSPEDGPAAPTTPDDDLWAADPDIAEDRAPARKPARRTASGSGSDRPGRTGVCRAPAPRPAPTPDTDADATRASDPAPGADATRASDPAPGPGRRRETV